MSEAKGDIPDDMALARQMQADEVAAARAAREQSQKDEAMARAMAGQGAAGGGVLAGVAAVAAPGEAVVQGRVVEMPKTFTVQLPPGAAQEKVKPTQSSSAEQRLSAAATVRFADPTSPPMVKAPCWRM